MNVLRTLAPGDADLLLERLTRPAQPGKLKPIPFPEGTRPTKPKHSPSELGDADVLVVTWTAAEAQALADVLSPGFPSHEWHKYTRNWVEFEKELTGRSPAREEKSLALWTMTEIAGKQVALVKSNLHLSTDAQSLPVRKLWTQLVGQTRPKLIITTGTAGGIGDMVLGDVAIAAAAKFNCQRVFKDEAWAQAHYANQLAPAGKYEQAVAELMAVNADTLKPIATRPPVLAYGDVETVDYFGFDDVKDSYGIAANDPNARTEEMDDATLPLALEGMESEGDTPWVSVRNASDPQVPTMADLAAEKKWAAAIYAKYGYYTTVCSAIASWALIADL